MANLVNTFLSYSAFEAYNSCPFKYNKIYNEKVKEPNNKYFLYGSAFHSLLYFIYINEIFSFSEVYKIWPSIFYKEANKKKYQDISKKDLNILEKNGFKDINSFFSLAKRENILTSAINCELELRGNYRGRKLVAKIDQIRYIKGGIGIIDWKTGNPDKKVLMQLAIYAALYSKKINKQVDWLVPIFFKTGEVVYQSFDDKIKIEAGNYFRKIFDELIEDTHFLPKKNKYCYSCMFSINRQCPLFK